MSEGRSIAIRREGEGEGSGLVNLPEMLMSATDTKRGRGVLPLDIYLQTCKPSSFLCSSMSMNVNILHHSLLCLRCWNQG